MKRSKAFKISIKPFRKGNRWGWRIIGSLTEEVARCEKWQQWKTSALAVADAREYVKRTFPKDVARLNHTSATMPELRRGSVIEKIGDLQWILDHGDYVFLRDKIYTADFIQRISVKRMQSAITRRQLFLAVPVEKKIPVG